jgi:uncharacterized protein
VTSTQNPTASGARRRRSPLTTGVAATVLAGAVTLLAAGPALAHVTVQPNTAAPGSYTTVVFKVPNEEQSADTTKVQVFLPTDRPIASVAVQPVPGWSAKVVKTKLKTPIKTDDGSVTQAVSEITWTGKLAPGQFQQFPVSLGPLPGTAGPLVFKAIQTYSDNVVRWIDLQKAGQPEPEHPAPVLTVQPSAAPSPAAASAAASPAPADTAMAAEMSAASHSSDSDSTARVLGIIGIVVGALGVVFGVTATRRRPSAAASGSGSDSPSAGPTA